MTEVFAFLKELLKITLPAGIVLYGMYITSKNFLSKDFETKLLKVKADANSALLPVRLQAYERIALFLERVKPSNSLLRISNPELNTAQFQFLLINEIRQEFNHNLSQQIYMSDEAWELVRNAQEDLIAQINHVAQEVGAESPSNQLMKAFFERLAVLEHDGIQDALLYVKNEIRDLF